MRLLERQHEIYLRWKEKTQCKNCSFYEWMLRESDTAFILRPGDLLRLDGETYCVVEDIIVPDFKYRDFVSEDRVLREPYPKKVDHVLLRRPDGKTMRYLVGVPGLQPGDIPQEVFALACGKEKNYP